LVKLLNLQSSHPLRPHFAHLFSPLFEETSQQVSVAFMSREESIATFVPLNGSFAEKSLTRDCDSHRHPQITVSFQQSAEQIQYIELPQQVLVRQVLSEVRVEQVREMWTQRMR
jgi:hypothetical protein